MSRYKKGTVDHQILMSKLYHYGIRGQAYKWFSCYLTNRFQFVRLNNCISNFGKVETGVPKDQSLDLYSVYINDIGGYTYKLKAKYCCSLMMLTS